MSYLAYICYRQLYNDDNELIDEDVDIVFSEPERYLYSKVILITFTPLHSWSEKDANIFTK